MTNRQSNRFILALVAVAAVAAVELWQTHPPHAGQHGARRAHQRVEPFQQGELRP